MSVGKALEWVMELTGYHTQIKNEAVLISKNKDSRMVTRIYPITDLITPAKSTYPPGDDNDEDEEEDEGPSKEERAERLLEVIKTVVGKDLGD